jgi:ABC-type transport system involved in multi-copper enzyme maturation permease subunit
MGMAFTALVRRELVARLRTFYAFFCVAALASVCAIIALVFFPDDSRSVGGVSQQILMGLTLPLLAAAALFLPGIAAGAISLEREKDTYDLLVLTNLRPFGIVLGKFLNAVGFYVLLVIATAPAFAAILFLVGVDVLQLILNLALILSFALSLTAYGILCSILFRKTAIAIIASYIAALALSGCAYIVVIPFNLFFNPSIEPLSYAWAISPFVTLSVYQLAGGAMLMFLLASAYQILTCAIALFVAWWVLPIQSRSRPDVAPVVIDDAVVLETRRKQFPYYLIDPARRKSEVEDMRNPMLVKELRWGFLGKMDLFIRTFYVSIILYFILTAFFLFNIGDTPIAIFFWVQSLIVTVAVPAFMANALTKEHELGNADMLRMTLLQPNQVILGKWYACIVGTAPLIVPALLADAVLLIAAFLWIEVLDDVVTGTITLLVCTVLAMSTSFLASTLARSTTMAIIFSYLFAIIQHAVLPGLLFGTLILLTESDSRVIQMSPLLSGLRNLVDGSEWHILSFPSPLAAYFANFEHLNAWNQMSRNIMTPYWALNTFTIISISYLIFRAACWHFKRYRMLYR